jgi:hypothetical protein
VRLKLEVAVILRLNVGVAPLLEYETVDPVTETSEAAVTVPGGVEVIDANEVVAVGDGKLAVNVNSLTEGVASVSPMLDRTTLVTKCSFEVVSPPHLRSLTGEGTYFWQAPATI